jgi:F0F1-type ATP synthase membrane subunit a
LRDINMESIHNWREWFVSLALKRVAPLLLCINVETKIYKTISLPLVLYGCKIWSLTLRERHRLST